MLSCTQKNQQVMVRVWIEKILLSKFWLALILTMKYQQTRLPKKRKYRKRSDWNLNDWLEKAWDDGLQRPTEDDVSSPREGAPLLGREAAPLSAKAIKSLIYMKGWLLKDVAEHWHIRPESLSRIIRSEHRSPMFEDAVLGLPLRRNGSAKHFPEVRKLLMLLVCGNDGTEL